MKKFRNKGLTAFIILSLLSLYGQQAFAFSSGHLIQEDSGDPLFSQTYQNTEGLLFQQIFFGNPSEYSEHNSEYFFGGGAQICFKDLHFRNAYGLNNSTKFLLDHRNDLKHKIYPFHFFW